MYFPIYIVCEVPSTTLDEEEQRAEREHARRYNLKQQKELLKNSSYHASRPPWKRSSTFVSLKRLTLRTSYGAVIPTLPTLTHLHLINPSPSNHTISSLTSSLSSLTYLRLTSFTHLPDDLVATYIDPGYIAHMREFLWGTIPDRYPLAAAPPRKPHAPPPTPAPMVFCATSEAEFDEMVESVQELSEAYANVKLLWPVKKDWERRMPMFPLSRADGPAKREYHLLDSGEWEWDADGREGVKFWWNKSRI
ncbi:hypothetical protein CPB85DRAFT_1441023 [Mucidula mucida]|nr:hypothetical protein CPB85DRAFT_1441023 [Mucidula mucida]